MYGRCENEMLFLLRFTPYEVNQVGHVSPLKCMSSPENLLIAVVDSNSLCLNNCLNSYSSPLARARLWKAFPVAMFIKLVFLCIFIIRHLRLTFMFSICKVRMVQKNNGDKLIHAGSVWFFFLLHHLWYNSRAVSSCCLWTFDVCNFL